MTDPPIGTLITTEGCHKAQRFNITGMPRLCTAMVCVRTNH